MNSTLTDKQRASLKAKFDKLKNTAESVEDVAKFFKKNPLIVPGLPNEFASGLDVQIAHIDIGMDEGELTIVDQYAFTFDVLEVELDKEYAVFKDLTGLEPGENISNTDHFRAEYNLSFSALEWRFVAAAVLSDLDALDLKTEEDRTMYSNILQAHFPHQSWDAFLSLWHAGLIPDNSEDLIQYMKRPVDAKYTPLVPNDFNL